MNEEFHDSRQPGHGPGRGAPAPGGGGRREGDPFARGETAEHGASQPVDGPAAAPLPQPLAPGVLPALTMEEVSCRTCRYFAFAGQRRDLVAGGECRRKAPAPGPERSASWLLEPWQAWWGEWQMSVSDDDMMRMARAVAESMRRDGE